MRTPRLSRTQPTGAQVSFTPPPWPLFTIIEPRSSATRLRPPASSMRTRRVVHDRVGTQVHVARLEPPAAHRGMHRQRHQLLGDAPARVAVDSRRRRARASRARRRARSPRPRRPSRRAASPPGRRAASARLERARGHGRQERLLVRGRTGPSPPRRRARACRPRRPHPARSRTRASRRGRARAARADRRAVPREAVLVRAVVDHVHGARPPVEPGHEAAVALLEVGERHGGRASSGRAARAPTSAAAARPSQRSPRSARPRRGGAASRSASASSPKRGDRSRLRRRHRQQLARACRAPPPRRPPGRHAHLVLEHPEAAVRPAHHVQAGHGDPARDRCPAHRGLEVRGALHDRRAATQPGLDDPPLPVDVARGTPRAPGGAARSRAEPDHSPSSRSRGTGSRAKMPSGAPRERHPRRGARPSCPRRARRDRRGASSSVRVVGARLAALVVGLVVGGSPHARTRSPLGVEQRLARHLAADPAAEDLDLHGGARLGVPGGR